MGPSNRVISGFCLYPREGDPLDELRALSIRSFVAHGHEFHLYTYGAPDIGAMNGLVVRDAGEIISREEAERLSRSKAFELGDLFLWTYLLKKGGWAVGTEVVCLRPFDFSEELIVGLGRIKPHRCNVLKIPKAHPMAAMMVDAVANPRAWTRRQNKARAKTQSLKRRIKSWIKLENMPGMEKLRPEKFLPEVARRHKISAPTFPYYVFKPVARNIASYLTNEHLHNTGMLQAILKTSHAAFLWGHVWGAPASEHSLIETLKRRHPPH